MNAIKVIPVTAANRDYLLMVASSDPNPENELFVIDVVRTAGKSKTTHYLTNQMILDEETKETTWAALTEETVLREPETYIISNVF